jgi:hypothetical protein
MILQLLHWRLGSRICSENNSLLRVIFYPTLLVFLTTLQDISKIESPVQYGTGTVFTVRPHI